MSILEGRKLILAVTGGIAAYKAADLTSRLVQAGARVDVVLTKSAGRFITPLTFEALTRRPVHTDLWPPWTEDQAGHVTLAADAELLIVAPATANAIARLAIGMADDVLSAIALATSAPLVVAPAMEHGMYHHPATQEHLATLQRRGATIVGPASGRLASGASGDGRLVPPEQIVGAIRWRLGQNRELSGEHVVVTAGGTQEPLDPVRYLGNRSSGQMGYALAQAAIDAGAQVTLISGPTSITPPWGSHVIPVRTAAEMHDATRSATASASVLIMAAAVADFRPAHLSEQKIKKRRLGDATSIALEPTDDILASIAPRAGLLKIGFAAETELLVEHATEKLRSKRLDMIVANDATTAIGATDNAVTIILPDGDLETIPSMPKVDLAAEIIRRVVQLRYQDMARTQGTS